MKNLNTFPIEEFLDKARIAIKTNQKNITLTIKEVADLQNSISMVMTRLAGNESPATLDNVVVKLNGGGF
jgi:hypothetical protein